MVYSTPPYSPWKEDGIPSGSSKENGKVYRPREQSRPGNPATHREEICYTICSNTNLITVSYLANLALGVLCVTAAFVYPKYFD